MRQIDDGLRQLFAMDILHFIEQQGQHYGKSRRQKQLDHAQFQRVLEGIPEIRHGKQPLKIRQPDPYRVLDDGVLRKGIIDAEHGQIVEHDQERQYRQKQHVKAGVFFHAGKHGFLLLLEVHSAVHAMTSLTKMNSYLTESGRGGDAAPARWLSGHCGSGCKLSSRRSSSPQ